LTEALARLPAAARAGAQALAYAAMRRLGWAMYVQSHLVTRRPSGWIDGLMLTALAAAWADDDPSDQDQLYTAHTLVNQAVEAVKTRAPHQAAFVNAVLRRFLRERAGFAPSAVSDPVARWNHPLWWQNHLRRDWPDDWQTLLAVNFAHPPMTLRVNRHHMSVNDYLQILKGEGLQAHAIHPKLKGTDGCGVQLTQAVPVDRLPGFRAGWVSVQDEAAQAAAPLLLEALGHRAGLQASKGLRILDACAAPGGKTAHLLELAPEAEVLALDSDAQRLTRVQDTLDRLTLHAELRVADAGAPETWWDGRLFDAILLDAPCSGSGVARRHPDMLWLRRESDLPQLAATQSRLLDALWPLLKPGGCLLYATCSVFKIEGQHQFDAFLQRTSDAKFRSSPGHWLPVSDNQAHRGPEPLSADGFFYGLAEKSSN
jgi:16S rRNA (cytosine967-C5)-methyltransferase